MPPPMLKGFSKGFQAGIKSLRGPMTTRAQRFWAWFELIAVDHGVFRLLYRNGHQVSPRLYRSAQPSPGDIAFWAAKGVKTVINLRGARDDGGYLLEDEACKAHGISHVDLRGFNSREPPRPDAVLAAKELFSAIEYPALIHCKSGADRAGLVAAVYLMLMEQVPVAIAKRQLAFRYGHVSTANTGVLDAFLNRYEADHARDGRSFEAWVKDGYDPMAIKAGFRAKGWANILVDGILGRE